jgi:lipopolysaccharide export system permease protein
MMSVRLIDLYILKRVSMPLLAAVGIGMAALLMERLIRLLDMFANRGSPISIILKMLGNLVPHYLGIALPAALFVGVLYASMRLSNDSELDAMRASGISLRRLMMPIIALAIVLTIVSSYILGFLQPYTRFAYRALVHLVTETQWDSAIERGAFFSGFGGKTILIGDISEGGRKLDQIFVKELDDAGRNIIITAEHGDLSKESDLSLVLTLRDGIRTETSPAGDKTRALIFKELALPLESVAPEPFRRRGDKESELTLSELFHFYFNTPAYLDIDDIKAEINARLVNSLSIVFLPLLAMPVGISSRRTSKSLRLLVGVVFLIFYYEVLQFGEQIVGDGLSGAMLALWLPFLVFSSVSVWLFNASDSKPGYDPLSHIFDTLDAGLGFLTRRLLKLRWWRAA